MAFRRMGLGSNVDGDNSRFAPSWRGWLILIAVSGALCLSPVPAVATMLIEEISVDSIDTEFVSDGAGGGVLTINQDAVGMVLEWTDGTQEAFSNIHFTLVTSLIAANDASSGGQAKAEFVGGTISITDGSNGDSLLFADITSFFIEEAMYLPWSLLVGSGGFVIPDVGGGSLAPKFTKNGIIFDISWKPDPGIDDFTGSFTAESDVTLTPGSGPPIPEPATMSLLAMGGAAMLIRRKRRGV